MIQSAEYPNLHHVNVQQHPSAPNTTTSFFEIDPTPLVSTTMKWLQMDTVESVQLINQKFQPNLEGSGPKLVACDLLAVVTLVVPQGLKVDPNLVIMDTKESSGLMTRDIRVRLGVLQSMSRQPSQGTLNETESENVHSDSEIEIETVRVRVVVPILSETFRAPFLDRKFPNLPTSDGSVHHTVWLESPDRACYVCIQTHQGENLAKILSCGQDRVQVTTRLQSGWDNLKRWVKEQLRNRKKDAEQLVERVSVKNENQARIVVETDGMQTCPICTASVPTETIQQHANDCFEKLSN